MLELQILIDHVKGMLSGKELMVNSTGIRAPSCFDPFENLIPDVSLYAVNGELQPMIETDLLNKRETLQMFQTRIYAFPDRIILEGMIKQEIVIPNYAQVSQTSQQLTHSYP